VCLGVGRGRLVATKDQAYANLALVAGGSRVDHRAAIGGTVPSGRCSARPGRPRCGRQPQQRSAASAGLHTMVFNVAGFRETHPAARDPRRSRHRAADGRGISTDGTHARAVQVVARWPHVRARGSRGRGAVLRPERRHWLWLLAVPLSFHLKLSVVTLYVNDRYLFAGSSCWRCSPARQPRTCWPARRASSPPPACRVHSCPALCLFVNVMMSLGRPARPKAWVADATPAGPSFALVGGATCRASGRGAPVWGSVPEAVAGITRSDRRQRTVRGRFEQARNPDGRALLRALRTGPRLRRRVPAPGADPGVGGAAIRGPVPRPTLSRRSRIWTRSTRDGVYRRREGPAMTNADATAPAGPHRGVAGAQGSGARRRRRGDHDRRRATAGASVDLCERGIREDDRLCPRRSHRPELPVPARAPHRPRRRAKIRSALAECRDVVWSRSSTTGKTARRSGTGCPSLPSGTRGRGDALHRRSVRRHGPQARRRSIAGVEGARTGPAAGRGVQQAMLPPARVRGGHAARRTRIPPLRRPGRRRRRDRAAHARSGSRSTSWTSAVMASAPPSSRSP